MEKNIENLMKTIETMELETIRGMKDSLSDFFTEWVNSIHDTGYYTKEKHQEYTYHFGTLKNLLIDIENFKTEERTLINTNI